MTPGNGRLFDLTELEERFIDCAAKGEEFDCAPDGGGYWRRVTGDEIDEIKDWVKRKIRAEVIVALCTGEVLGRSVHPQRGLRLRGGKVVGRVDLSRADLSRYPLAFYTCKFEEGVVLS